MAIAHRARPLPHRPRRARASTTSSASSPAGGSSPTSASPTSCSSRPPSTRQDARALPRARRQVRPVHHPDRLPGRLDRHRSSTRTSARSSPGPSASGEIIEGEATIAALKERVRVLCIPVRCRRRGDRACSPASRRRRSGASPASSSAPTSTIFNRFARMIAAGDFPFDAEDAETEEAPRVGDGVILLDAAGRVEYTSPERRVGPAPHRASTPTPRACASASSASTRRWCATAFSIGAPVTEELERERRRHRCSSAASRCIDHGAVSGAVVLTRDVSELRRRDRLLLSKDATIREIHHRVKNNLQTISSLLRLQGRRFSSPEAKEAIEESVRRIRAIALVHETLSREAGDDVAFVEIVRPLVRMVEEGDVVRGPPGRASASRATPASCPPPSPPRCRSCSTSCSRTPSTTPSRPTSTCRPAPGSAVVGLAQRRRSARGHGGRRRGRASPEGFDLDAATGLGPVDRAHPRDHRADGHDRARARRRRRATGRARSCALDLPGRRVAE